MIDINADMGEYGDRAGAAREGALFEFISRCNIACGGHAGSDETMALTLKRAQAAGVVSGAHPSYCDRAGFGRRSMAIALPALEESVHRQISRLRDIGDQCGVSLAHLKPHGALYNDGAADMALARLLARVAASHGLVLVGPPGSTMEVAAAEFNLGFLREGFIDRRYQINGALVARTRPGAVIEGVEDRVDQGLALARGQALVIGAATLSLMVDTLCIHSDSAGAVESASALAAALGVAGIEISASASSALAQ